MYNIWYSSSYINTGESLEEFLKEIEEYKVNIKNSLPINLKDCDLSFDTSVDEGGFEINVYRSENKEELEIRQQKAAERELQKRLKAVRLDLVKDDPEYKKFLELKEKFKDLNG